MRNFLNASINNKNLNFYIIHKFKVLKYSKEHKRSKIHLIFKFAGS